MSFIYIPFISPFNCHKNFDFVQDSMRMREIVFYLFKSQEIN